MGTSVLMHDLTKFSDQGLQLRMPVDLIPAGQYSRLSNAIPRIEGILETREGVTLIAQFEEGFEISALGRSVPTGTIADTLFTVTPTNFFPGQTIIITVTDGEGIFATGTYVVTVSSVSGNNPLLFSPPVSAPGFTAPGADIQHAAEGNVTIVGALSESFIHTISRLNQSAATIIGERLVGVGVNLFTAPLPGGNIFSQLPVFLSGRPLSLIDFRFTLDTATWAIFTDGVTQYKYRNPYLFLLGNPVPQAPALATAGGTGNLNSTGGTPYDWRYTYFDSYVQTEGNPSPSPDSGTVSGQTSTAQFNPSPRRNNFYSPVGSTNNAFTGVTDATGEGTANQTGGAEPLNANSYNQASCIWTGFANPATIPFIITLTVQWQVTITAPDTAQIQCQLNYSTDGGVSFTNFMVQANASTGINTTTINLPLGTDLTQVDVEAYGVCTPHFGPGFKPGGSFVFDIFDIVINCNLSPTPTTLALVNKEALVCVTPPPANDGRITGIRLYRRGGSLPDTWRLVGTFDLSGLVQGGCGSGMLQIIDNVSDTTLTDQPIIQLDNDQPVTSVTVINQTASFFWGPAGIEARVLACGDPGRPECVYFSKPGNPDAWPPENFVEVSSPGTPIVAGCVWNTRIFAFSAENVFELVEGLNPSAVYTPFQTPSTHGLISPWGLVSATAMYFVAKDGIYMSAGGQEESIVENDIKPIFPTYDGPGQSVEGYEAVDMTKTDSIRLKYHNNELYFIYTGLTTGIRQLLIYDTLKKRWRAASYTCALSTVYSEPATQSSLLLGTTGGGLYQSLGEFDPDELDVIENASIKAATLGGVSLIPGNYFALITRSTVLGEVAISYEFGPIVVSSTSGIQVTFPVGPSGTLSWRIYYGTTQGAENQYMQFLESGLPTNRTENIIAAGTAGTAPTLPPSVQIQVNVRTGSRDQGAPLNRKQYSNAIFDLDSQTNVITITPYINGEAQANAAITISTLGRQQIPVDLSDFFAFNVEYGITWSCDGPSPILYQYDTLYFTEPAGLKHWQMQPTSFEFPGFCHARDAYIAIRSTQVVTLSMVMDETTTQTYTLLSTGGQRQKIYVQFASNKWKEMRLALDSIAEFRVYEADLEYRVKPWVGLLGYSVQRPFEENIP